MTELERCRVWIEAALEYGGGTHLFEDIAEAISEGRMQLWPAKDSCIVTERDFGYAPISGTMGHKPRMRKSYDDRSQRLG